MKIRILLKFYFLMFAFASTTAFSQQIFKSNTGSLYIKDSVAQEPNFEKDTDGDGIPDEFDECIEQKENYNFYQDDDGCYDTAPYPDSIIFKPNVPIFVENSADINEDVVGAIAIDLAYYITEFPVTHWLLKIETPIKPQERAVNFKSALDNITGDSARVVIEYSFAEKTQVYLVLDVSKIKKIQYNDI